MSVPDPCLANACQGSLTKACKVPSLSIRNASLLHTYTRCIAMLHKELAARSVVLPCVPLPTLQTIDVVTSLKICKPWQRQKLAQFHGSRDQMNYLEEDGID